MFAAIIWKQYGVGIEIVNTDLSKWCPFISDNGYKGFEIKPLVEVQQKERVEMLQSENEQKQFLPISSSSFQPQTGNEKGQKNGI